MNWNKAIFKLSLVAFCGILLSGCAIFKGGNVPEVSFTPTEKSDLQKPSISYEITAMSGLISVDKSADFAQSIIAGEFLKTLEDSNYFGRIAKNDTDADVSLVVVVKNTGSPVALLPAILTGLSLYIIPSWATDHFDVNATAQNKNGLSKEYVLSDTTTIVQWLPMMFVFPFKNFSEVPEVRKNIYRNILIKMKEDGLVAKKQVANQ